MPLTFGKPLSLNTVGNKSRNKEETFEQFCSALGQRPIGQSSRQMDPKRPAIRALGSAFYLKG